MKNIILIGMPGAGKSTVGVLLAKSLLMDFCDTDLIIQRKAGKALCDIINETSTEYFIKLEEEIIASEDFSNTVVATGGSAVYGSNAMEKLKKNGVIIYLQVNLPELTSRLGDITTRGIAMDKNMSLSALFSERSPLYEKYAHITVDCTDKTPEECVNIIVNEIEKSLNGESV